VVREPRSVCRCARQIGRALIAAALSAAILVPNAIAGAETIGEAWRSPFGTPRALSPNPTDGSVWAATGSSIMHLAADGTVLSQTSGFSAPFAVAVNPKDGSCWVGDTYHNEVVHLDASGNELWRGDGFTNPGFVSVNSHDGTVWVANWGMMDQNNFPSFIETSLVHLSASGAELWRSSAFVRPISVSAYEADGSCWVADELAPSVIHLDQTGKEMARLANFEMPMRVSVNQTDGSCYITDGGYAPRVARVAADGSEMWRRGGFYSPVYLSVDSSDGSCWVGDPQDHKFVHLAADGQWLWEDTNFSMPTAVSANTADGSCWVGDSNLGQIVHFTGAGVELWRGGYITSPAAVSVDISDGSCWVLCSEGIGSSRESRVLLLSHDGAELLHEGGFSQLYGVSANSSDGSCWVIDDFGRTAKHLLRDGTVAAEVGGFSELHSISVNPTDGSWWTCDDSLGTVGHYAADGPQLWQGSGFGYPMSVAADETDGSCWVLSSQAIHLAEDGTVLWQREGGDSLAINPTDGSYWVGRGAIAALGDLAYYAADGTELWQIGSLDFVNSISANPIDGTCWVANNRPYKTASRVLHVGPDGTVLSENDSVSLASVSVDPGDGSCWVEDSGNGQVVHLVVVRFDDVPLSHWAFDQIAACAYGGIVAGYPNGTYHPSGPVTRDQMAVYISRALAGGDAQIPTGPAQPTFPDVTPDYWAYKHVEYAASEQIVTGYPDGLYHPGDEIDRAQMAVFIARAIATPTDGAGLVNYTPPATATYPDVPTGFWAYKYVEYIAQPSIGVIQGYPDGDYHPEYVCTRDQMAVYVARAFRMGR
jgi:DNA-binding beta-propeller fold protein YncE